jgi:hypothetical protein
VRRWVLSGAAGGSRGFGSETNVSPGIQPGDRQHSAGKLFIGEGAGAGRWGKSGQSRDHDIPYPLAHFCCCFLRGVRPGGGQNVCFSCLAIYLFRTHARPQNSGFHKIASRISGSLPALATAGSGGRWHFFCSRHEQLWLKTPPTKRDVEPVAAGMGPEMLEPIERRNRPLVAYTFPQNRGNSRRLARLNPRLCDDIGAG